MVDRAALEGESMQEVLARLEVDVVGVALLAEWEDTPLATAARRLLPSARSVVVMGMEVYPEILAHTGSSRVMGEGSLSDLFVPHLDYLESRLTKAAYDVARASHRLGLKALPLPSKSCPVDVWRQEAFFSFKGAAQAAGLGAMGKSSLLITPQFGPRVRLACALTEADLVPTRATVGELCTDCNDCLASCPSQALGPPEPGQAFQINRFACCAYRGASGGCSECMKVCPVGR